MRVLTAMTLLLCSGGVALAQAAATPAPAAPRTSTATTPATPADAPAIHLGLWETTTTTVTKLPPQMAEMMKRNGGTGGGSTTAKTQSCLTAETWQKTMNVLNTPRDGCTMTTHTVTAQSASFEMTCAAGAAVSAQMTSQTFFDSLEKVHGTMHVTTSYASLGPIAGGRMVVNTELESHFVSEECGTVGAGKVVTVK